MLIRHLVIKLFAVVVLFAALAYILPRGASAFTNEYSNATCNRISRVCNNCLVGIMTDPVCTGSQLRCITFQGTYNGTSFFTCEYASGSSSPCYNAPLNPPATTCMAGTFWKCACRSLTFGDCNPLGSCPCSGSGDGTTDFTVNSVCTP
jgi:hypothetical protein